MINNNIGVSVAMATFNGEKYIEKQIQSILKQTLPPEEIVICDDVSADSTVKIIHRLQSSANIKLFVNDKQLGVVENFKKAVSLCKENNYVALSDQDDIWLPEKLSKSYNALQAIDDSVHPCMIYTDLILVDSDEKIINNSFQNDMRCDKYKHSFETLLFGSYVSGCTMLMNNEMKEHFSEIPLNSFIFHDEWIAMIAESFGKINYINESLIKYRKHTSNVVLSNYQKVKRSDRALKHLKSFFLSDGNFLKSQIILAKKFLSMYSNKLTELQKKQIENLINLEDKSYFIKKLTFEKVFFNKWIKRF